MIVFLIGFMGSGKSHYARGLSAYLNVPCYDLDAEIEHVEGKSINQIFAENGEPYFRSRESEILKETVAYIHENELHGNTRNFLAVIACGGGTPCFEGNMDWMNQHGITVWIAPPVEVLAARLEKEKEHRPLIRGFSHNAMEEFIRMKLSERTPYYEKARLIIENPDIQVEELIKSIKDGSNLY